MTTHGGMTFLAKVADGNERALNDLLARVAREGADPDPQEQLVPFSLVETLHFARFAHLRGGRLVFVTSFDGSLKRHLRDLSQLLAHGLDQVFRLCEGYFRCTGSVADRVHEFLRQGDQGQGTFFVGAPGLEVWRVQDDARLHRALRKRLAEVEPGVVEEGAAAVARFVAWGVDLPREAPTRTLTSEAAYYAKGFAGLFAGAAAGVPLALLLWLPLSQMEWSDQVARERAELQQDLDERARREDDARARTRTLELNELALVSGAAGQRPLTHVVDLKRGLLRSAALRLALTYVGYRATFLENQGTLAGIASIHFARWVRIPGDRLLFVSDYDGDWEAYLGEFVDLASSGISGIWSNTVDFPVTRRLTRGGSRDEWRFKKWVRRNQEETHVFYSAYPELTVGQIRSNARLRRDLSRMLHVAEEEAAEKWLALI